MRVIYTEQAICSLEESIRFYIDEQGVPTEIVDSLVVALFDRTDSLSENPYLGQYEEYLEHLNEGHRRLVEGHFKIIYKIDNEHVSITDFYDTRQDPEEMKG
jgi:plasmid stabilization system protein ParE